MITKTMFQFHNGTINTAAVTYNTLISVSFNSTTVQLILPIPLVSPVSGALFQFHNGTINTQQIT